MNQPDVLSQIQPEEHNTDDQPRPEASEIPADASEGKRKDYILLSSFSWVAGGFRGVQNHSVLKHFTH